VDPANLLGHAIALPRDQKYLIRRKYCFYVYGGEFEYAFAPPWEKILTAEACRSPITDSALFSTTHGQALSKLAHDIDKIIIFNARGFGNLTMGLYAILIPAVGVFLKSHFMYCKHVCDSHTLFSVLV
jgi:hypothetical protein